MTLREGKRSWNWKIHITESIEHVGSLEFRTGLLSKSWMGFNRNLTSSEFLIRRNDLNYNGNDFENFVRLQLLESHGKAKGIAPVKSQIKHKRAHQNFLVLA